MKLEQSVSVPSDVLVRVVSGEAVVLNLESEDYFGLDEVGTDFWAALTETGNLAGAVKRLQAEFDADPDQIEQDFRQFVQSLVDSGLLSLNDAH